MKNHDLDVPMGLSKHGNKAAQVILDVLRRNNATYTGGCKAFYTPEEWKTRGEKYGLKSELVVVHDGGDLAPHFNFDYEEYNHCEDMNFALEDNGLYHEPCTSWYTAIYNIPN